MAVFPAVRAKEDRCENPASATLRVFGIVGYRDQLAELAAGLACWRITGLSPPPLPTLPSCSRGYSSADFRIAGRMHRGHARVDVDAASQPGEAASDQASLLVSLW